MDISLSDIEYTRLRALFERSLGIDLPDSKRALVVNRLSKRLRLREMSTFAQYHQLLISGDDPDELQTALDLITTNETYFWREHKHFEFLRDSILTRWQSSEAFRVWCAASSSGEEPYSVAMLLDDSIAVRPWEIVASDISTRVLKQAQRAVYPMDRATKLPDPYLRHYCMRGINAQAGQIRVSQSIRRRVQFRQINLCADLPDDLADFHLIFLRNVLIYFDQARKNEVVERVISRLCVGGYLFVGHSEALQGFAPRLCLVQPAIYLKLS